MRLLQTESLELHEFHGDQIPEYAILSHTWGQSEVSFETLQARNKVPRKTMLSHGEVWEEVWFQDSPSQTDDTSEGWQKIKRCCSIANQNGYKYVWIDTCCINKQSSAELTEAINSMFRWYENAEVCYAFLQGCQDRTLATLVENRWFTRGWTLQELIAPRRVIFFNGAWRVIGNKTDFSQIISYLTKIDVSLLRSNKRLEEFSVAERMSWAASRKTTRLEDRAYSLLGLFQVSIPLLYGEGEVQAFRRLQEEIIKNSDDHSIFAWPLSAEVGNHGLLAWTPAAFDNVKGIESIRSRRGRSAYSITNMGISITFTLIPWSADTYLAPLNCGYSSPSNENEAGKGRMGIFLRRLYEDDQYARIESDGEDLLVGFRRRLSPSQLNLPMSWNKTINVRQARISGPDTAFLEPRLYGFRLSGELLGRDAQGVDCVTIPQGGAELPSWRASDRILALSNGSKDFSNFPIIDISVLHKKIKLIRFGFNHDFDPFCFLAESSAVDEKVHMLNKSGQFNFGETSERQWTDKEREEFKSFASRSLNDQWGWNKIEDLQEYQIARANDYQGSRFRSGLWMLQGDRVHGLGVYLEGLAAKRASPGAVLNIKRTRTGEGWIWDLSLDGLASSGLGKAKGFFRKEEK